LWRPPAQLVITSICIEYSLSFSCQSFVTKFGYLLKIEISV